MTTYVVTRKSDSVEVYRYNADAPIEWSGMGFADHDHAPEADPSGVTDAPIVAMTWTKLEYLRRFTQAERIAIRGAAKAVPELEDYLQLLELASEVRSDDPDIASALAMLGGAGLIGAGRAGEILNG
jgi:hypothetical protein